MNRMLGIALAGALLLGPVAASEAQYIIAPGGPGQVGAYGQSSPAYGPGYAGRGYSTYGQSYAPQGYNPTVYVPRAFTSPAYGPITSYTAGGVVTQGYAQTYSGYAYPNQGYYARGYNGMGMNPGAGAYAPYGGYASPNVGYARPGIRLFSPGVNGRPYGY